jgi:hypothetical protein
MASYVYDRLQELEIPDRLARLDSSVQSIVHQVPRSVWTMSMMRRWMMVVWRITRRDTFGETADKALNSSGGAPPTDLAGRRSGGIHSLPWQGLGPNRSGTDSSDPRGAACWQVSEVCTRIAAEKWPSTCNFVRTPKGLS